MDESTLKNIKMFLERETGGQYEDEESLFAEGVEKFKSVLKNSKSKYTEEDYQRIYDEIMKFVNSGEAQERKIYNYCLTFSDPFAKTNSERENKNEEPQSDFSVETHRYLNKDELMCLYEFVKSHKKDKALGMVINQMLYNRGLTAPRVYDAAMLSRQDFSRMLNSDNGIGKSKIWNLIIGLHCNMEEADLLLLSAGYVRKETITDLVIEYFIRQKNYDILAINEALYIYGQKLLSVYTEVRDNDSGAERKRKLNDKNNME